MASAVVIDKTNGSIVRKLSLTTRLENITLAPNEILSWNEEFRSAAAAFDWQSQIIQSGDAVATIHCTRGCATTIDHVDVRVEGSNPADVCALIRAIYRLIGDLPVRHLLRHDPIRQMLQRAIARLRAIVRR